MRDIERSVLENLERDLRMTMKTTNWNEIKSKDTIQPVLEIEGCLHNALKKITKLLEVKDGQKV